MDYCGSYGSYMAKSSKATLLPYDGVPRLPPTGVMPVTQEERPCLFVSTEMGPCSSPEGHQCCGVWVAVNGLIDQGLAVGPISHSCLMT